MRVLIVSPHFPPVNAADMQRVRTLVPHLVGVGVECEVLSVKPKAVSAPKDPWLVRGLPCDVTIYRTSAMPLSWKRIPGMGLLASRAMRGLRRAGNLLLGAGKFDLVYFSTTQFGVHRLGPYWKQRFGIPFVMDYQDPWVNDYYKNNPNVIPPGGRLKYAVVDMLNRRNEPIVLRACSGITSVSAAYPNQLRERYSFLTPSWPVLVAPFPGDDADLQRAASDPKVRQNVFDPNDGTTHWVYVGRGGEDMQKAVRGIFAATKLYLDSQSIATRPQLKMHFVGTSYAAAGSGAKTIEPIAAEFGLSEIVHESPDRIPYSTTLRCLLDAHALIVPGSDDAGYTASKIYPYLLARKPLLAVFHEQSSVIELIQRVGGGVAVPFNKQDSTDAIAERIGRDWFDSGVYKRGVPLDDEAFEPHTARAQAREIAGFFRRVLGREGR